MMLAVLVVGPPVGAPPVEVLLVEVPLVGVPLGGVPLVEVPALVGDPPLPPLISPRGGAPL